MPTTLRIIAIIISLLFSLYVFQLVRKNRADVLRVRKWLFFSVLLIIGAVFTDFGASVAKLIGFSTYVSLALFALVIIALVFLFRVELSVITAEKQIKNLTQELSILKEKLVKK